MDALDMAVQGSVEMVRTDPITPDTFLLDAQKKTANMIERGRVLSGLVRVTGKGIPGKAVVRKVETATINILGMVGVAILIVLVLMPIPMILHYGKGLVSDVESSYKRAVMKNDGAENFMEVPNTAPSICAEEIDNRSLVSINHTFNSIPSRLALF